MVRPPPTPPPNDRTAIDPLLQSKQQWRKVSQICISEKYNSVCVCVVQHGKTTVAVIIHTRGSITHRGDTLLRRSQFYFQPGRERERSGNTIGNCQQWIVEVWPQLVRRRQQRLDTLMRKEAMGDNQKRTTTTTIATNTTTTTISSTCTICRQ